MNPSGSVVAFTTMCKRTFEINISKRKKVDSSCRKAHSRTVPRIQQNRSPNYGHSFGRSAPFDDQKFVRCLNHDNYIHHYSFDHCNLGCFNGQKFWKNSCPSKGGMQYEM